MIEDVTAMDGLVAIDSAAGMNSATGMDAGQQWTVDSATAI